LGLCGSAFISATEAAVLDASRYRIEHKAEEGDKRARLLIRIFDQYEKFFGTILLFGNLFNIMVASVGTTLAISTIGGGEATVLSTAVATALATVVVVVVGELTPKTVAVTASERWSLITARLVLYLMTASWPLVFAFTLVPRGVMRIFGGNGTNTSPIVTPGELRTLIDLGEAEGTVEENTGEMLENIFRFGEMEVRDVMTRDQKSFGFGLTLRSSSLWSHTDFRPTHDSLCLKPITTTWWEFFRSRTYSLRYLRRNSSSINL